VSRRLIPSSWVSVLEHTVVHLLKVIQTEGETVNQLNQNHNTLILLLVILAIAIVAGLGGLVLFTVLI
jgi:hypothetical protein